MALSPAPYARFNYRDYCLLPEDKRCELIDGSFLMTPSPGIRHQDVSKRIQHYLFTLLELKGLARVFDAPVDVYLSDEDVVQPDLIAVAREREKTIEEKFVRGAPDLVIEILSPTNQDRDLVVKKKLYHRHGVKEYWIVDPAAQSIEVWLWEASSYRLLGAHTAGEVRSFVFPELVVLLSAVF